VLVVACYRKGKDDGDGISGRGDEVSIIWESSDWCLCCDAAFSLAGACKCPGSSGFCGTR